MPAPLLRAALALCALAAAQPAAPPFSLPQPARTITVKMAPLPANAWTPIASLPRGTAGVVKQLQLWTSGPAPADVLFAGTFDGAASPQLGSNATSVGTPGATLALDVLLSPAFYGASGYAGATAYFTDTSGCNYLDETGVGGHYRVDMPFSDGFDFRLFNAGRGGAYWVIVTWVPRPAMPSPLRLFAQPFYATAVRSVPPVFSEISLLGAASPNGVVLKGLKVFAQAPPSGISWAEGKFRFYAGGPGFPTGAVRNYSSSARDDASYYNRLPGVDQLGSSSGAEDFFLSGFDWRGGPCYAHELAGTIHCDFYGVNVSRVTAYRFFGDEGFAAPPNTPFVATFTVNDQNFAVPSALDFFLGVAFYYA
jgi:hypothetical protein